MRTKKTLKFERYFNLFARLRRARCDRGDGGDGGAMTTTTTMMVMRASRVARAARTTMSTHVAVRRPRAACGAAAAGGDGGASAGARDGTGPWNTPPLALDDGLYSYLLKHTRESEVLRTLREETSALRGSQMQVAPEQGALLALMVELVDARRVIEIGTYTGYSSIAMASAMREGGVLYACDKNEESFAVARRYWAKAGVSDRVVEKNGDAKVSVVELLEEHGENSFDVGFIDADKRAYREYYEALLKLVRPGGLIIIDNVLWYGKVADETLEDKQTLAIREFNAFVASDERVSYGMVPIGDGLSVCRKR